MIFAPILFTVQSSEKHFIFPFRVPALDKDSYRADVDLATYFMHIPARFPGKPNDLDGQGIFGSGTEQSERGCVTLMGGVSMAVATAREIRFLPSVRSPDGGP
jgi:hypothetical protein